MRSSPRIYPGSPTVLDLFPLVRGEIFGTRVSCEARRAELSRYKFVCRWRYPGGTGEDQCGAQGRAFEVQVCLSVAMSGGTGEEQCGAQGRAFEVQVCLSVAMSGGTGEEQCGAQGRAFEVQVCLSVAMSGGTGGGKRRVLENQARTGSCQTNSGNQPGKGVPVESLTRASRPNPKGLRNRRRNQRAAIFEVRRNRGLHITVMG